jgi:trk system potassium uptake protein TrkH
MKKAYSGDMVDSKCEKGVFGIGGVFCFDRAKKIIAPKEMNPVMIIVLSFIAIILAGTLLLMLPFASKTTPLGFVDSLFTSTSATCVTGLVVKDTADQFSNFGQIIILFLIQIGGLGYMTLSTFFALLVGKKLGIGTRIALKENLNLSGISGVIRLARRVFFFIATIELLGVVALFFHFKSLGYGILSSIKYGVFHSVSAFNNAGFDLFGSFKSLTEFASDPLMLLIISALVIAGGLGFIVISNIYEAVFYKKRISLQTKIVILSSIGLIVIGSFLMFSSEISNQGTIGPMNFKDKIVNSIFQSISARTAGFNSIDIGNMTINGVFSLILLMFVGASPGGTGGGIKTVTLVVVLAAIYAFLKGKRETDIGNRSIDDHLVMKAMTVLILSLFLIIIITFILCEVNDFSFIRNLFETTSAFGTVGLSTGMTPFLNVWSKLIIAFTIFVGRIGILSFILSMYTTNYINKVHLPKEELSVG